MLGFMTGVMAQHHEKSGGKTILGKIQMGESSDSDSSNGGGKSGCSSFNERKHRNDSDTEQEASTRRNEHQCQKIATMCGCSMSERCCDQKE